LHLDIMTAHPGQPHQIAGSVLPLKKAEELLSSLQDVVSARIVSDASGAIDSIHVLVTGTSAPKQMVRNVESALMAQLGLRVDHRKISVATTVARPAPSPAEAAMVPSPAVAPTAAAAPKPEAAEAAAIGRALYFEDVEVKGSRAKGVTCRVTLRRGTEQYVGEAEGFESDKSRVEISARAALAGR
jgi:hypothetical protein